MRRFWNEIPLETKYISCEVLWLLIASQESADIASLVCVMKFNNFVSVPCEFAQEVLEKMSR